MRQKYDVFVSTAVGVIASAVYLKTLAPSVSFWDCGEFITCSYILGVPHPPGAPLYVLIGRIFTMLPFFGDIAPRINLISAVVSGATVFLACLMTLRLLRFWWFKERNDVLSRIAYYTGGIVASLSLAFSHSFWFNAVEAEVYALSMFFTFLGVWIALVWMDRHKDPESDKLLVFIAYLFGLGGGVHLLCFLTLPTILAIIFFTDRRSFKRPWLWIAVLGFFLFGYSTYYALFIRSSLNPVIDVNNPENLNNFRMFLQRQQYGEVGLIEKIFNRTAPWGYQIKDMFAKYFLQQFQTPFAGFMAKFHTADSKGLMLVNVSLIPILLGLAGMLSHACRDFRRFIAFFVMFLLMGLGLSIYLNMPIPQVRERHYIFVGSFSTFAVWMGIGAAELMHCINRFLRKLDMRSGMASSAFALLIVAAIPIGSAVSLYHSQDRTDNYIAYDYGYNILESCEQDSILFTGGDNDTYPLWYLQEIEGVRKDVSVVNLELLNTTWYIKQLRDYSEPGVKPIPIRYDDREIEYWCSPTTESAYRRYRAYPEPRTVEAAGISWEMPISPRYNALRPGDIMVYNMVKWNNWERPVCFAITVANENIIGLDHYLQTEGMVFRLVKSKGKNQIDTERTRRNIDEVYRFRGLMDPKVYKDPSASRLISNYRVVYFRLALAYLRKGRIEEARQVLRSCGERILMDWESYYDAARILADAKDREGAAEFIERAEDLAPAGNEEAQLHISRFYFWMKDLDRAASVLRELIDRGASNPETYGMLASILKIQGNYLEAIDVLEGFVDEHPEHTEFHQMIRELKGKVEQAPGDSGRV